MNTIATLILEQREYNTISLVTSTIPYVATLIWPERMICKFMDLDEQLQDLKEWLKI